MMASGNLLIEAQKKEEQAGDLLGKRRTSARFEDWKQSRRLVEQLAVEYLEAIREWREALEAETKHYATRDCRIMR